MVFTESIFLFAFLPLVLGVYYALPMGKASGFASAAVGNIAEADGRGRKATHPLAWRNGWLTLAGFGFYGWFEPWFVLPMAFTCAFDWACGLALGKAGLKPGTRKAVLVVSMASNLGLLAVFKYGVFTQENLSRLLQATGQPGFSVLEIAFPIGISFYTFHSMSYVIDVYRGLRPVHSLFDFACFVSLFPQLVAGPILRYGLLAEQLRDRLHSLDKFARGTALFFLGFAMKILLANPAGEVADAVFAADKPAPLQAWWGVLAYAFQIYFDFNGYSVMALGLGRMVGFELIRNFDAPYHAYSITDFWRRWHLSLSGWLKEYLYIPLGGNRRGERRTYANLAVVMLLGGLWHGAAWQFLFWGALHGFLLAAERWAGKRPFYRRLPRFLRIGFTFTLILVTWVFFRADGMCHAFSLLGHMTGWLEASPQSALLDPLVFRPAQVGVMAVCALLVAQPLQAVDFADRLSWIRAAGATALFLLAVAAMATQAVNPFLYFQF